MKNIHRPIVALITAAIAVTAVVSVTAQGRDRSVSAMVQAAVLLRLGTGADVHVVAVDANGMLGPSDEAREVRIDPSAELGKPIRVTVLTADGVWVRATASLVVLSDRVVTQHAIPRNATVTSEDVEVIRGDLIGMPLRPLPTSAEVIGRRALRPMTANATVLAGDVLVRRAVEPGDRVSVIAATGAIQVSASLVAADGGRAGDVIRVVNPDTKRYLRGRVVQEGIVEVINER